MNHASNKIPRSNSLGVMICVLLVVACMLVTTKKMISSNCNLAQTSSLLMAYSNDLTDTDYWFN